MAMNSCPLCSNTPLLRHASRNRLYWYCNSCREEVVLNQVRSKVLSDRFLSKTPVLLK
ncbi:MAG: hypothetical protein ACOC0N_11505 [Chroococcales cyanobacterium]